MSTATSTEIQQSETLSAALAYARAGLSIIPDRQDSKAPAIPWGEFQKRPAVEWQIRQWFPRFRLGIVCGYAGVEVIDFDLSGEQFEAWCALVEEWDEDIYENLLVETTPSGGRHVVYRCTGIVIPGNQKLSQRNIADTGEIKTLIETRGTGGQFLCAPNPGYKLTQGDFAALPVITPEQREILLNAARSLNEYIEPVELKSAVDTHEDSPAEEFNATHEFRDILLRHDWKFAHSRGNRDYYTRPGKNTADGISASVTDGAVFYNWSSNVAPFKPETGYSKFQVYALLEHGGDMSAAAGAIIRARPPSNRYTPVMSANAQPERISDAVRQWVNRAVEANEEQDDDINNSDWPEMEDAIDMRLKPTPRPVELIEGIAFTNSKISMSSNSKGHKTFFQIDMGVCIAAGIPWYGYKTKQGKVLYINLELCRYSMENRLLSICQRRGVILEKGQFMVWNLRGKRVTIERIATELERRLEHKEFDLLILDPLYKCLGDRSENDNSEMADLFSHLEQIAEKSGSAYIVAHHFAKGSSALKTSLDRGAGAGVITRDGDTIITLTQHEGEKDTIKYRSPNMPARETDDSQPEYVTMEITCRDLPPPRATVLRWDYPVFEADQLGLDPKRLKSDLPTNAKAPITEEQIFEVWGKDKLTRQQLKQRLIETTKRGINSIENALACLLDSGRIDVIAEPIPRAGNKPIIQYYHKH